MDRDLLSKVASLPLKSARRSGKEVLGGLRLGMIYVPAIQRVPRSSN